MSGISFRAINIVALIFLTPFQLSILGLDGYGLFILLSTVFGFGGILDLGLSQIAVKYYSTHENLDFEKKISLNVIFIFLSALAFLLSTTFCLLSISLEFFDLEMTTIIILAVSLSIKIYLQKFIVQLTAIELFHQVNSVNFFGFIVRQSLPVILVSLHVNSMDAITSAILFSLIFQYLLLYQNKALHVFASGLNLKHANLIFIKKVLRESFSIFIIQLNGEAALHGDKFIISSTLGLKLLAIYNLAYIITARMNDIGFLIASLHFPELNRLFDQRNLTGVKKNIQSALGYTILLGTILLLLFYLFGELFLFVWLQNPDPEVLRITRLLLIGAYLGLVSWTSSNFLITTSNEAYVAKVTTISTVFSILLCWVLTNHYGLMGAAVSWVMSYTLLAGLVTVRARLEYVKLCRCA